MISSKNDKGNLHSLFFLKIGFVVLAFFTLFFDGNSSIANERNSAEILLPEPPRYRVFNLKHISAEQTRKYFDLAGLNVEVQILREDMFSVTGLRPELIKASQIVKLVDVESKFIIKSISIPPDFNDVSANEEIASQVGDILIGSFSEPPSGVGPKAIIEQQGQKLLVIAPVGKFSPIERIITNAIRPAQESQIDANLPADTNQPTMPEYRTYIDANEMIKTDSNDLKIPDINDLTKVADANKIEGIDANELPATDINESSLVDVFDRLITSLGEKKVAETRVPIHLQEQTLVPAEVNEPNKPAIEEREQIIQKLEKPQQPEKIAAAVEKKILDQNEPQPLSAEQAKIRSYQPEFVVDSNEQLTIEVPEKLKIIDLLGLAGEYLNVNYMYDPAQVQGEITLKLSGKNRGQIKVKELYPLVEAVLKYKGLVMTRTENNLVIIAPKTQAKDIDPAIIEAGKGQIRIGDVIVTRIFELNYIDAESAKNLLVGMNLGEDINTSASGAGLLIVTGYAYRMPRIEQLLSLVDVPGPAKEFRFRQLKYTMAATLKDKIKTLADQLGTVSITVGETAAAQPATPSPRRRGESTAAYRARVAREARARRAAPTPAARTAAEPESVYLDVDERTNRILMIGLPEQLDTVEGLIDTLDVQQQDVRSLRLYEIQNVDAAEVTGKLQELGIISSAPAAGRTRTTTRGQRTTTAGRTAAERTTPAGTPPSGRITAQVAGAAPEQEPLIEEPQVVIIESTNSLLVNATAEQHAQIAMIIGFVDAQPEEAAINYVVYPLENQDPEELANILNQLIEETIERRDPTGKVVGTETTRKTEEDITILADKNTFSIIVYASKKNQQWIESLIHQLDKRRPQVLIDVTLVEISRNEEFTLDLDLLTKYPTIPLVGSGQTGFVGTVTSAPDRRLWEVSSISGVGGSAFYADEHIQALLGAMNKKGYGRILAKPKLLVNDNEQGTINTSKVQTIVSPKTTVIPGTTTTQATYATDVSMAEYTEEIKLDITPHISEGDLLRLEITMTRTDFGEDKTYSLTTPGGSLSGPIPPDLLSSNIQTIITVPDRKTIILGGLEKLKQSKGGTKVPILGDIPLVGGLFRNVSNTDTQNRLYVFVKANILRPVSEITEESDIVKISKQNRAKFENYEKEMQEYEDWPGIKPKPMDPVKILEED